MFRQITEQLDEVLKDHKIAHILAGDVQREKRCTQETILDCAIDNCSQINLPERVVHSISLTLKGIISKFSGYTATNLNKYVNIFLHITREYKLVSIQK